VIVSTSSNPYFFIKKKSDLPGAGKTPEYILAKTITQKKRIIISKKIEHKNEIFSATCLSASDYMHALYGTEKSS
jgi:hypothetical protein